MFIDKIHTSNIRAPLMINMSPRWGWEINSQLMTKFSLADLADHGDFILNRIINDLLNLPDLLAN